MTLTGYIVGTKGNTGRGIASIVENADYTITINLTDGSSYTTAPIAGFTAVEFDENYDLVVTKTDGTTETVETDIADYNTLLEGYKSEAYSYMQGAVNSASSAYSSAQSASGSASDAGTYAGQAYNYATSAQTSATNASSSATAAGTAKTAAETAQGKAEDAQDAAETAQGKAEDAQEAAETAATNANTYQGWAQDYANNAQTQAGYASTYKQAAYDSQVAAATSALVSEGYANGEQNGTPVTSDSPYYENNAKYYSEEAAASAASLVIEDALDEDSTNALENGVITKEFAKKANIDGAYESMTVGNAEQLVSTVFVNDEEPYNFRTAGGSADIGDREYDTIVGGTVGWNQLCKTDAQWNPSDNGIGTLIGSTYKVTPTGYAKAYSFAEPTGIRMVDNHVYFVYYKISEIGENVVKAGIKANSDPSASTNHLLASVGELSYLVKKTGSGMLLFQAGLYCGSNNVTQDDYVVFSKYEIIDLTAMLGTSIADYIYSLETANAGAGVAWFRSLFPKTYYAYNAGELMSVQAASHDMVGFNALDSTAFELGAAYNPTVGATISFGAAGATASGTNPVTVDVTTGWRGVSFVADVVGNQQYQLSMKVTAPTTGNIRVSQYFIDENNVVVDTPYNWVGNAANNISLVKVPPKGGLRMVIAIASTTVQAVTVTDPCLHLVWDGERDGEYEEYVKHSYPLDSDLTLRGIPKLDASNNLYYDGDTYESDGTVTRRFGIVDLGTLTWGYTSYGDGSFYASVPTINKASGWSNVPNIVCSKYKTGTGNEVSNAGSADKVVSVPPNQTNVIIKDLSYGSDATSFKTAMSGVYLVYELATPTTESADPYTNPQIVNDFGTEEYVDYAMSEGDRDVAIPVGHITKYTNNLRAKLEMSPNSPDGAGDYLVRQTNGINEYVSLSSNATIQDMLARIEALEGGGE